MEKLSHFVSIVPIKSTQGINRQYRRRRRTAQNYSRFRRFPARRRINNRTFVSSIVDKETTTIDEVSDQVCLKRINHSRLYRTSKHRIRHSK